MKTYYNIGEDLYIEDKYQEAYDYFKKALDNNEEINSSKNYMGCCLIGLGKYEEAINVFDSILNNTLWERPMFNKGRAYLKLENYTEAFACFNRALMINQENADVYYYLGVYYEKIKDYINAKKYYLKSIEIDDSQAEPHLNLGLVYFHLNEFELSIEESKKVLEIDINYTNAKVNIGFVLYRQEKYEEALKVLLQVIEIEPNAICVMNKIANSFYYIRNYDNCLIWLNRILEIDRTNKEAIRHKEIVLKKLCKNEESSNNFD